jgi:cytochrome P450
MADILSVRSFLFLLFACYTVTNIVVYYNRFRIKQRLKCQPPPTLSKSDMFGIRHALQLIDLVRGTRRNIFIKEQFERCGPTFMSQAFGTKRYHTIEPRNVQAVFAMDFEKWGVQPMRLFAFKPFVGAGIMCVDGKQWQRSRALIKPTFARGNIADVQLKTFTILVDQLLLCLPKDGSTIDLQPFFGRLALDSSTEFLFGKPLGALSSASEEAGAFLKAYNYGQMIMGKRMYLPQWNVFTRDARFWKSCKVARSFVKDCIIAAAEYNDKYDEGKLGLSTDDVSSQDRYVLARELLRETNDQEEVLNQLLNVFLPAHEASGVALGNLFFNLARHPRVYAKARQEVLAAYKSFGGSRENANVWTFERLKSLSYLQNVMKESQRLTPSIGTTTRMALQDTTLPTGGGLNGESPIFVEKGSVVMFSFYSLHRRTALFGDDAEVFRPERWETFRAVNWSYMPFGGGPRICAGQQLALMEVAYTTVRILLAFEQLENRDPVLEFIEEFRITTTSKNGVQVGMTPVQD